MKKRKKLTSREFWEKYGAQFERTDRHLKELIEELEARRVAKQAAREQTSG